MPCCRLRPSQPSFAVPVRCLTVVRGSVLLFYAADAPVCVRPAPDPAARRGPCLQLRCALEAGYVPTLESLMRAQARQAEERHARLAATSGSDEDKAVVGLPHVLDDAVLPVFVQIMAYGSLRSTSSLIATIGKLASSPVGADVCYKLVMSRLCKLWPACGDSPWPLPSVQQGHAAGGAGAIASEPAAHVTLGVLGEAGSSSSSSGSKPGPAGRAATGRSKQQLPPLERLSVTTSFMVHRWLPRVCSWAAQRLRRMKAGKDVHPCSLSALRGVACIARHILWLQGGPAPSSARAEPRLSCTGASGDGNGNGAAGAAPCDTVAACAGSAAAGDSCADDSGSGGDAAAGAAAGSSSSGDAAAEMASWREFLAGDCAVLPLLHAAAGALCRSGAKGSLVQHPHCPHFSTLLLEALEAILRVLPRHFSDSVALCASISRPWPSLGDDVMAALLARGSPYLQQRLREVYAAAGLGTQCSTAADCPAAFPQAGGSGSDGGSSTAAVAGGGMPGSAPKPQHLLLAPCRVRGLLPFQPCANTACSSVLGPTEAEASRSYVHVCRHCRAFTYCSASCMQGDFDMRHFMACTGV